MLVYIVMIIATVIIAFGACVHLFRVVMPFDFIVGSYHVPTWMSLILGIVGIIVAYVLFISLEMCY